MSRSGDDDNFDTSPVDVGLADDDVKLSSVAVDAVPTATRFDASFGSFLDPSLLVLDTRTSL